MGISRSFGTINRTQISASLYKKGLPLETSLQIRQCRKETALCAKHQGRYGRLQRGSVGVSQDSALSALLFIIYLDGMMQDNQAIDHNDRPPMRIKIQRRPETDIADTTNVETHTRTTTQ